MQVQERLFFQLWSTTLQIYAEVVKIMKSCQNRTFFYYYYFPRPFGSPVNSIFYVNKLKKITKRWVKPLNSPLDFVTDKFSDIISMESVSDMLKYFKKHSKIWWKPKIKMNFDHLKEICIILFFFSYIYWPKHNWLQFSTYTDAPLFQKVQWRWSHK